MNDIVPKCKNLNQLYIDAKGYVWPCCWISLNDDVVLNESWNIKNNDITTIQKSIKKWIKKGNFYKDCSYHCNKDYKRDNIVLHLELTSRCLLGCPKCPRTKFLKNPQKTLEIGDLDTKKAIEFIKNNPHPEKPIMLSGSLGDPLYHPELIEIISEIDNDNQYFWMSTNGTGKKLEWWRKFFNSYSNERSVVSFGLDGLEDTAHIYRVRTNYQEVLDVMKFGVSLNKRIQWQFIPFSFNEHQIEEAKKIADDNGIQFVLRKSERWNDRFNKSIKERDPLMPTNPDLYFYKDNREND